MRCELFKPAIPIVVRVDAWRHQGLAAGAPNIEANEPIAAEPDSCPSQDAFEIGWPFEEELPAAAPGDLHRCRRHFAELGAQLPEGHPAVRALRFVGVQVDDEKVLFSPCPDRDVGVWLLKPLLRNFVADHLPKHLVLCAIEKRPPRLDLDFYPYLPKALVETTKPASYMSLMAGAAS
jgi:hypothetical protein